MKKRKKYNLFSKVSLYINYTFQKTTLIIFGVSLILITGFLILMTNPWMNEIEYLLNYETIHKTYLTQGLFIIQIFNSIIISTIVISLMINCNSFDSLFISYTPRYIICIAKILALLIVIIALSIFEILVLNIVPIFMYSKYSMDIEMLLSMVYLFTSSLVESLLSIVFTTIFTSVISPMVIMLIFIMIRLLCNNFEELNKIIKVLLPVLQIEDNIIVCSAMATSSIFIILVLGLYISIYNIKDL